jgi:hypothetical protein
VEFLSINRKQEDLELLGKICFDTLSLPLDVKDSSDLFCGIYFEGRVREINKVEDFSVVHSFKIFSEYNYPIFISSPNSNNLLNNDIRYKNCRIIHIKIPECNSHDKYSQFMMKHIWDYIPKQFERLLFFHPDGFLIKSGWERFVIDNKLDYVGSAWCHAPSIDTFSQNEWKNFNFPRIQCGNGGFSYRSRFCCERISKEYSQFILRESGREDNRPPPEDLFYSHIMNGIYGGGFVANIKQCMKFSLDPITLNEYNNKLSFGFHYPKRINDFQGYRNHYLTL